MWAFVLANSGLFIVGSLLTALSYLAYRQSGGQRTYERATVGFGFVVPGGLAAPAFQFGTGIDYTLTGNQILLIGAVETVLAASGLGLLFFAIVRHDATSAPGEHEYSASTADVIDGASDPQYAD